MQLVTSSVFSPGTAKGGAYMDQILLLPRHGLLAVADAGDAGPEGRAGLRIALDAIRGHVERNEDILERFRRNPTSDLRDRILGIIDEGFTRASRELYAFARRYPGLRLSLDVALLLEHEAFVGHVGDGRVYLVRRGLVHQLTVDHDRGTGAAPEDGAPRPKSRSGKQIRALGPEPKVRVESLCMELSPGDRFVVTSAHLYQAVPDGPLHQRLVGEPLDGLGPSLTRIVGSKPLVAAAAQLGGGEATGAGAGRSRLAILAPMPLFAHCSERELRLIASATTPRRFSPGTVLFRKAEPGNELFLVISGAIRIEVDGKPIVTLGPGSNFGEMAMLDEPRRSADAIAIEDTECMVITREAFFALLKGNPKLAVKILWNLLLRLSARLRSTSDRLTELTELTETDPPPRTQPEEPPAELDEAVLEAHRQASDADLETQLEIPGPSSLQKQPAALTEEPPSEEEPGEAVFLDE